MAAHSLNHLSRFESLFSQNNNISTLSTKTRFEDFIIFTKLSDTLLSEMEVVGLVLLVVIPLSAPEVNMMFHGWYLNICYNYFTVFSWSTANLPESTKDDGFGRLLFLFLPLQIRLNSTLVKTVLQLQGTLWLWCHYSLISDYLSLFEQPCFLCHQWCSKTLHSLYIHIAVLGPEHLIQLSITQDANI